MISRDIPCKPGRLIDSEGKYFRVGLIIFGNFADEIGKKLNTLGEDYRYIFIPLYVISGLMSGHVFSKTWNVGQYIYFTTFFRASICFQKTVRTPPLKNKWLQSFDFNGGGG